MARLATGLVGARSTLRAVARTPLANRRMMLVDVDGRLARGLRARRATGESAPLLGSR